MDINSERRTTEHAIAFNDNRLALSGPLAFCIFATNHFLSVINPSPLQKFTLICFAIAIPLLASSITLITLELRFKKTDRPWYVICSVFVGIGASIIGSVLTFFAITLWSGIIFLISVLLSLVVLYRFIDRLQKLNPEDITSH